MKILKREISGMGSSKKVRTLFATSKEELEILSGIAEKAIATFPDVKVTQKAHQRLRNMGRNFKKALTDWNKLEVVPATDTYQDAMNIVNNAIRSTANDLSYNKKDAYVIIYDLLRTHRDNNDKIKGSKIILEEF